jgi:predicted phosphodiesterase
MKIGVITDIHSNPAALEAVLREFSRLAVDGVICLGDIIGIGAQPRETVEMVRAIPNMLACVRGNHEKYLLEGRYDKMDDEEREFHLWEHARLSADCRAFLAAAPMEARLEIDGVSIWAAHYPHENGNFMKIDSGTVFDSCPNARVCLCGHDHARSVQERDGRVFADFGSLGCPGSDRDIARAGILHIGRGDVRAQALDIRYDVAKTLDVMDRLDPPARKTVQRIFYGI